MQFLVFFFVFRICSLLYPLVPAVVQYRLQAEDNAALSENRQFHRVKILSVAEREAYRHAHYIPTAKVSL